MNTKELQEPKDGWYREKKTTFNLSYKFDLTHIKVESEVINNRNLDIQQYMRNKIENDIHMVSVKLYCEPLGYTEHEYRREEDKIVYYGWSNCD